MFAKRTNIENRGAGYTRPELCILAGILSILLAVILPTYYYVRNEQQYSMVRSDIQVIQISCQQYFNEYGFWPSDITSENGDQLYGLKKPNAAVFNILRAVEGVGNVEHLTNSKRIEFLEIKQCENGVSGLDDVGNFIDPWGNQYFILLDTNLDNICHIEAGAYSGYEFVDDNLAVWSNGPDGIAETSDDITSFLTKNI